MSDTLVTLELTPSLSRGECVSFGTETKLTHPKQPLGERGATSNNSEAMEHL